jgi:hypothetical protein
MPDTTTRPDPHRIRRAQAEALVGLQWPALPKGEQILWARPRSDRKPSLAEWMARPYAWIVEAADLPGYYHVHVMTPREDGIGRTSTVLPIWGRPTSADVNWVWATAAQELATTDLETFIREDDPGATRRWEQRLKPRGKKAQDEPRVWDESAYELQIGLTELPEHLRRMQQQPEALALGVSR